MATNEIGSVSIGIEADTRRFRQQMQQMGNQGGSDLNRTLTNGLKAGAIIASVKLIGDAISGVTRKAMQFEASTQQVDRIFGENSQTIKNWARTNAIAFNMSTNNALKFSATYGGLISNITDSQVENAQLTQEMLKQTAVIASGTGRTMEDVGDRIRSGLLGSTEAIEDLFINVNVSMLESTEAFRKFAGDKSWAQLDFKTQQQIRLNAILEQSYKMYGDEVNKNTSSSLSRLSAIMSNISLNIGQVLKPVIDSIINSMIILATSIERVTGAFAKMINRITGTKNETKAMADNTKDAIAGQDELGDAIAGAGKKAKRGVAGFDEVNQLQEEMASSGTGTGGVVETEVINKESIEKVKEGTSKLEKMFKSIKEKLNPTLESLRGNITRITAALKPMFEEIGKLVKIILKEMSPVFGEVFNLALITLRNFGNIVESVFKSSALIIEKTVKIIRQILERDFSGAFNTVKELLIGLWGNFKLYFGQIMQSTWESMISIGNIIRLNIMQVFNYWNDTFTKLNTKTSEIWNSIGTFIVKTIERIKEIIFEKVKNIKNFTINTFAKMSEVMGNIWTSIKDTTKRTWAGIWNVVKGFINLIISGINKIIEAWNSLEFKLPKKTFDVFGKKVEFGGQTIGTRNIQSISPLATGGNVQSTNQGTSQRSGILTEQTLDKLGQTIGNALQGNKDTIISIDGKKIGRAMIPILNNENSRTGNRTVIQTG